MLKEFDTLVQEWFFSLRNDWLTQVMTNITNIGSTAGIVLVSVVILAILIRKKRQRQALGFVIIIGFGYQFSELLKIIFRRQRPPLPWLGEASGFSFPSGHSLVTMTLYSFLFLLIFNKLSKTKKHSYLKNLSYLIFFIPIMVGFSRIYLGVHYPSDVLGGWFIGIVWTLSLSKNMRIFEKKDNYK